MTRVYRVYLRPCGVYAFHWFRASCLPSHAPAAAVFRRWVLSRRPVLGDSAGWLYGDVSWLTIEDTILPAVPWMLAATTYGRPFVIGELTPPYDRLHFSANGCYTVICPAYR